MNLERERADKALDEVSRLQKQVVNLKAELAVKTALIEALRGAVNYRTGATVIPFTPPNPPAA